MAKDRNGSISEKRNKEDEEEKSPEPKSRRRARESLTDSDSDDSRHRKDDSSSSEEEVDRRRSKKVKSGRKSSRRRSYSSDSESESESGSSTEESYSESESEEERSRRKRRERKRRKREKEKKRRRRERKEKEKEKEKKRKKRKRDKKKEKSERGKKGAVTDTWGKYGVIRETDMWNKRPEFTAWLLEVKQINLESLPNWEEKQLFKEFMEDHNTATFPSKKYYSLDAYFKSKIEKEIKKGMKNALGTERTVFNDEEQRRLELLQERERVKEEQVQALKVSMQSGMAQAMKEQALLREEMAYQFKLGNHEAAAAIQRRLDPDSAI